MGLWSSSCCGCWFGCCIMEYFGNMNLFVSFCRTICELINWGFICLVIVITCRQTFAAGNHPLIRLKVV